MRNVGWLALPIVVLIGEVVVVGVAGDVAMLTDAFGLWGLSLFLFVPALVGLYAWLER